MEGKLAKKKTIGIKTKLSASLMTFLAVICIAHASAYAAVNPEDALKEFGITPGSVQNGSDSLYGSLQDVVYLVMAIGGFWGILWIVIGGILLSGSGGNPNKRNAGFACLALAAGGLFVIYKAYDIAGWATGLGT